MFTTKKTFTSLAAVAALALTLSACGSGSEEATDEQATPDMAETTPAPTEDMTEDATQAPLDEVTGDAADPAATLAGAGRAAYAEAVPDGAGSVGGMAQDPVATAASNNPLLTTLTAAVSGGLNPEVNLVSTLNSDEFTVFAPVDEAFALIDPATIDTLKTDTALLSSILTYHVVPGQLDPTAVVGEQTTVQGGTLEVTGSGDDLMVNGASVICGGVQTANATVYLIDTVLMPPAE